MHSHYSIQWKVGYCYYCILELRLLSTEYNTKYSLFYSVSLCTYITDWLYCWNCSCSMAFSICKFCSLIFKLLSFIFNTFIFWSYSNWAILSNSSLWSFNGFSRTTLSASFLWFSYDTGSCLPSTPSTSSLGGTSSECSVSC